MAKITFNNADVDFNLKGKRILKSVLKKYITENDFELGNIDYIFCSDSYLLDINKKYLNHDYFTDIISFQYDKEILTGEIFISIDRVKENASIFKKTFNDELYRVISHGILHFMGYKDKTVDEQKTMRSKEDELINSIYIEKKSNS
ncbi:MAG: rRNA maturation RNase YbeY [Saprospiraceae bacterium]